MKTKEFIEKVEALGYEVKNDCDTLLVKSDGEIICDVSNSEFGILDTDSYVGFKQITVKKRKEIFLILADYALTDPTDRKEEKRYWLRLDVPVMSSKQVWSVYYLNKQKEAKMYRLGSDTASTNWQTIFTESEISQMDITGFDKIEVSE